ncbi:hypothetical protein cyc_03040 [Cyclospora cayetanensis]|uniref:Uncharacterized protein n=1 Tax=Cyclospora cayetanensis TaxID=88456 RepID=A0A1D3D791_9EIME|nr:hypothetical protein cyc_03040 [Cyclospora cayetanensis]
MRSWRDTPCDSDRGTARCLAPADCAYLLKLLPLLIPMLIRWPAPLPFASSIETEPQGTVAKQRRSDEEQQQHNPRHKHVTPRLCRCNSRHHNSRIQRAEAPWRRCLDEGTPLAPLPQPKQRQSQEQQANSR